MNGVNERTARGEACAGMLCLCVFWASVVNAQTPGGPVPHADSAWSVTGGVEIHRDRFGYEFANPSNIDTPLLVPHTFAQTYVADNQWLVASARDRASGNALESEFAFTPQITAAATDIDTFYDADNDVVTSGTRGDARTRSVRFTHWSEGELWGLPVRAGYRFRRDRSDFLPADIVVTHSNPPSETRRFTTDREHTTSQVHNLLVDLSKPTVLSARWTLVVGATLSPLVFARLTTRLPDKYPDPVVADARSIELDGRLQLVREGRWPVLFGLEWGKSWSYRASRQFEHDVAQVSARLAYRP